VEQITLPTQLVQQIVNYLQTQPFNEVNGLIGAILRHSPKPDDSQESQSKT